MYMCFKSYWQRLAVSLPVTITHFFPPSNSVQLCAGLVQTGSRHEVYQKSF